MVAFSLSSSLAVFSLVASVVRGVDVDGWRSRSIYQVLTDRFAVADGAEPKPCDPGMGVHCGGSWRGIYEQLDYIQGMNFDAIWISPIVAQMPNWTGDGEAYPGYWQQDLYQLNPSFGSEEDLRELVDGIHQRGMLFMLDIVVNHMVGPSYNDGQIDYSLMRPFNDEKYFHPYCPSGYSDKDIDNLQNCWLGSEQAPLADLKTESQEVRDMLGLWIKNQVWKYGVDGLRIDAAINVPAEFFTTFMESAGVFATSEVYTRQEELACKWSETIGSILNYPLYWPMTEAFQAETGSMQALADMVKSIADGCKDPTVLGNFVENHDVPRFRNATDDMARARNLAAYLMTADGIPVVYYGFEQNFNGNVEPYMNRQAMWEEGYNKEASIYKLIATLNLFRRFVGRQYEQYLLALSEPIGVDANTIAWAKGGKGDPKVISVLSNKGADASDYSMELCDTNKHGYSAGDELFDIVACKSVTVDNSGCITAWISDGEPVVLFKKSDLQGSTLCGISGDNKVELTSKAVISTTWTSVISGVPTVLHTASTVNWADAPSSITATATNTAGGNSQATSAAGVSAPQSQSIISLLSLAIIPAMIFSGSLALSLDRFLR